MRRNALFAISALAMVTTAATVPVCSWASPSAPPTASKTTIPAPTGRRWAILIGIDLYRSNDITPLTSAGNDARNLADALVQTAGFPKENVLVFTGDGNKSEARQPLRSDILAELGKLRFKVKPGDTVFFFYAGHGLEVSGVPYLLPYDADISTTEQIQDTCLPITKLRERLSKIPAGVLICAYDMCRVNPDKSGRGAGPNDTKLTRGMERGLDFHRESSPADSPGPSAVVSLFACKADEKSYEWTEKQRGFFSYYLEKGIRGEAKKDGVLRVRDLDAYLTATVPGKVYEEQQGRSQKPECNLSSKEAAEIVLIGIPPDRTKTAALPPKPPITTPVTLPTGSTGSKRPTGTGVASRPSEPATGSNSFSLPLTTKETVTSAVGSATAALSAAVPSPSIQKPWRSVIALAVAIAPTVAQDANGAASGKNRSDRDEMLSAAAQAAGAAGNVDAARKAVNALSTTDPTQAAVVARALSGLALALQTRGSAEQSDVESRAILKQAWEAAMRVPASGFGYARPDDPQRQALCAVARARALVGEAGTTHRLVANLPEEELRIAVLVAYGTAQATEAANQDGARQTAASIPLEVKRAELRAAGLTALGRAQAVTGDDEGAKETFRAAEKSAYEIASGYERGAALGRLCAAWATAGETEAARRCHTDALVALKDLSPEKLVEGLTTVAQGEFAMKDNTTAKQTLVQAREAATKIGTPALREFNLATVCRTMAETGDMQQAQETLKQIEKTPAARGVALAAIAIAQAHAGDGDGAKKTLELLSVAVRRDPLFWSALAGVVRALAETGHTADARQILEAADPIVRARTIALLLAPAKS